MLKKTGRGHVQINDDTLASSSLQGKLLLQSTIRYDNQIRKLEAVNHCNRCYNALCAINTDTKPGTTEVRLTSAVDVLNRIKQTFAEKLRGIEAPELYEVISVREQHMPVAQKHRPAIDITSDLTTCSVLHSTAFRSEAERKR